MASNAPPPLFQGVDKGSFAYKLLNKMGWQEGKGLVSQAAVMCAPTAAASAAAAAQMHSSRGLLDFSILYL